MAFGTKEDPTAHAHCLRCNQVFTLRAGKPATYCNNSCQFTPANAADMIRNGYEPIFVAPPAGGMKFKKPL